MTASSGSTGERGEEWKEHTLCIIDICEWLNERRGEGGRGEREWATRFHN